MFASDQAIHQYPDSKEICLKADCIFVICYLLRGGKVNRKWGFTPTVTSQANRSRFANNSKIDDNDAARRPNEDVFRFNIAVDESTGMHPQW